MAMALSIWHKTLEKKQIITKLCTQRSKLNTNAERKIRAANMRCCCAWRGKSKKLYMYKLTFSLENINKMYALQVLFVKRTH